MSFPRGTELLVIVILLILVFGWKRLPDAARSLGRSARVFKSEVEEMKKDGKTEAGDGTVSGSTADLQTPQQVAPPSPVQDFQSRPQQAPAPTQPTQSAQDLPDDPTRPVA